MEKKSEVLTIRLSESTKKQFFAEAEKIDRSASWLAVNIIEQWLKKRRRK